MSHHSEWSVGLCECGGCLYSICCKTWCCPCVTFGQIAEIVSEEENSCIWKGGLCCVMDMFCLGWLISCLNRKKLRTKYGLSQKPCHDCCVHFLCGPFALCQEYAHLKSLGFRPSKGWNGPPTASPMFPPSMSK